MHFSVKIIGKNAHFSFTEKTHNYKDTEEYINTQ